MSLKGSKKSIFSWIYRSMTILAWLCCCIILFEICLIAKERKEAESNVEKNDTGFNTQHLHPYYYFFFPQDAEEIIKLNGPQIFLTSEGFRGEGPGQRGTRELAFLVGGSAAFGDGASNDKTTITGYLNQIQNKYHFVNAGVPSWVSTQEFYRVSLELIDYNPALIIAYNGYNDAYIAHHYRGRYPAGTPESYEFLEKWVDDIRSGEVKKRRSFAQGLLFSRTYNFLKDHFFALQLSNKSKTKNKAVLNNSRKMLSKDNKKVAEEAASRYLKNLQLMQAICTSNDASFIAILQPFYSQHNNIVSPRNNIEEAVYMRAFIRNIFQSSVDFNMPLDYSNVFDQFYDEIPKHEENGLFIDNVHVSDRGNNIIAQQIVKDLKQKKLL